jgi:hypothetical protein
LPGTTLKKGSSHSVSLLESKSIFFRVSTKMIVSALSPSMSVWVSRVPSTMGSTTSGYESGSGM